jgi:osmotically-inducible protein OsmY
MPAPNPACPEATTPGVKERAESCLGANPYLALRSVCCDYREGVLVLRGCLPSYHLKQVAQKAVARLEGVGRIDNQIQVVTSVHHSLHG